MSESDYVDYGDFLNYEFNDWLRKYEPPAGLVNVNEAYIHYMVHVNRRDYDEQVIIDACKSHDSAFWFPSDDGFGGMTKADFFAGLVFDKKYKFITSFSDEDNCIPYICFLKVGIKEPKDTKGVNNSKLYKSINQTKIFRNK